MQVHGETVQEMRPWSSQKRMRLQMSLEGRARLSKADNINMPRGRLEREEKAHYIALL